MANDERKNKGRQRVAMMRMEKESNRLVTFSKRRSGLFKKASELCTLCGAEATILVFSPGRKAFSFGHPSVDTIIHRFSQSDTHVNSKNSNDNPSETHEDPNLLGYNMQLTIINNQAEIEKKRYEELMNERNPRERGEEFKKLTQVDELGLEDLKKLQESLSRMKNDMYQMYHQMILEVNKNRVVLESPYNLLPEMMGGDNNIATGIGGHPHQMVMVGSSNNFDHSQMMMIQTPMNGFGDPSLTMGSNGIAMEHLLNANTYANSNIDALSMPNPMGLAFSNPNLMPSFQGENNPIGVNQFDGLPSMPSSNVQGMNPMLGNFQNFPSSNVQGMNPMLGNFQNFPSSLPGVDSMNAPIAPFHLQNGFGFGFGHGNGNGFN